KTISIRWTGPVEGQSPVGNPTWTWTSECGTYRVVRVGGIDPRFAAYGKISVSWLPTLMDREIATDLRTLGQAFERIDQWHLEHHGEMIEPHTYEAVVSQAEKAGLDRRPPIECSPEDESRRRSRLAMLRERRNSPAERDTPMPIKKTKSESKAKVH